MASETTGHHTATHTTGHRTIDHLATEEKSTMNSRERRVSSDHHHMAMMLTALIHSVGQSRTPMVLMEHTDTVNDRSDLIQTVPRSSKASSNWLVPLVTTSAINSKVHLKNHHNSFK